MVCFYDTLVTFVGGYINLKVRISYLENKFEYINKISLILFYQIVYLSFGKNCLFTFYAKMCVSCKATLYHNNLSFVLIIGGNV